jgi:hypothetical protein
MVIGLRLQVIVASMECVLQTYLLIDLNVLEKQIWVWTLLFNLIPIRNFFPQPLRSKVQVDIFSMA